MLKKKVVKVGTSFGIVFTKQERDIYNIKYGDTLDLDFIIENKGGIKC